VWVGKGYVHIRANNANDPIVRSSITLDGEVARELGIGTSLDTER